jgi:hypothetical protein
MKTRMGLVSNSSSSSFICNRPIFEVARDMWRAITSDHWNDDSEDEKTKATDRYLELIPLIEEICKKEDVQTGKYGISMPSCNYDTEILVIDGKCKINTCHNHDWSDVEGLKYISEEDYENYSLPIGTYFYDIKHGGKLLRQGNYDELGNRKLICSTCKNRWGKQNEDMADHSRYFYRDPDGNYYCPHTFTKLEVVPK